MTMSKTEIQDASEADIEGFRRHLGPFVVAAETTRMAMVFTNAKSRGNPIVFANQAFLNLTGFEEHEVLGQRFDAFMERGTDPDSMTEIQTAMDGGRELEPLVRYKRKDASAIWVTVFITPVRNEEADIEQHFASFVDVTRHKDEEDRLRAIIRRFERSIE